MVEYHRSGVSRPEVQATRSPGCEIRWAMGEMATIRPLKLDQEQTVPRLLLRVGKPNMERLSVRRKRRERKIGSVGRVAGLAEPRRRRILLPERGTAAVRRKCGRNVGPWVYTVGVRDVKMEIPDNML
jgi:hypothetical protein